METVVQIPYTPNAKQEKFHTCPADEAVYGGAKGGGKSCALVMEALAYGLEYKGAEIYLFRETYDELEANIIKEWKEKIPGELYKFNETKHFATIVGGSRVFFRYIKNKADAEKYNGRSIDFIGVDELTRHTQEAIQILLSCVRSPKGFPPRFRGTCNPGGIGHAWVKRRYILPTIKGERMYRDRDTGNVIAFIPAKVYDNEVLMKNDPAYVRRLENLPTARRRAFLDGDWDAYEGQAFEEWKNNPNPMNTWTHVIPPFILPDSWERFTTMDWGYSKPFSVGWWAIDFDGILYRYRELYGCSPGEPDVGIKMLPVDVAAKINEIESRSGERIAWRVADPAIWAKPQVGGPSVGEFFSSKGIFWLHGKNDRIQGKMQLHNRLKFDEEGRPGLYVFNTCRDFIRTLPELVLDETNNEDVDTRQEDHIYDETRYGLMERPDHYASESFLPGSTPGRRKAKDFDKDYDEDDDDGEERSSGFYGC